MSNFKRFILTLAISVGVFIGSGASASLYSYYQERGLNLPSVEQRVTLAEQCGISGYIGSYNQNVALEACLRGESLGASIPIVVALYTDSLATKLTETSTSTFTLIRGTDKQDRSLSGYYGFVIDEGTTNEEFILATCAGITCTINTRGIDIVDGETNVLTLQHEHRRGAVAKITNFPQLAILSRILNGQETTPGGVTFGTNAVTLLTDTTTTDPTALVTFGQLSRQAIAGAANASTLVKGIVEEATNSELELGTTTGSTGARLYVNPSSWLEYSDNHFSNNFPAGENVTAFNILYMSSTGSYYIAHANVQAEVDRVTAVNYDTVTASNYPRTLWPGSIIYGNVSMASGTTVYLSDTGTATTTAGTIRKVLGIALGGSAWQFNPTIDTPSAVPTANTIPIANASGTLPIGWYSGVTQAYTAGESINASSAPLAVYLNSTDGRVYKTASGVATTTFPFIGFAVLGENKTAGQSISVQFSGNVSGFTGMTTGSIYYISTAGSVSSTAGTINYKIGRALSPTVLYIEKGSKVYSGITTFFSTASTVITTGFMPSKVTINAVTRGTIQVSSNGSWTANGGNNVAYVQDAGAASGATTNAWYLSSSGGLYHNGTVTSLTATGFTLSNTETSGAETADLVWTATE